MGPRLLTLPPPTVPCSALRCFQLPVWIQFQNDSRHRFKKVLASSQPHVHLAVSTLCPLPSCLLLMPWCHTGRASTKGHHSVATSYPVCSGTSPHPLSSAASLLFLYTGKFASAFEHAHISLMLKNIASFSTLSIGNTSIVIFPPTKSNPQNWPRSNAPSHSFWKWL